MLRFLAQDKEVLSAHVEVSLDMSLSETISQDTEVVWSQCDLEEELRRQGTELPSSPGASAPKSITEVKNRQRQFLIVIYSAVSSPQDRSKRFTLYFPDRPVHSDTISASLGSIQPYATINARRLLVHIPTTVCSQVLIYTAE